MTNLNHRRVRFGPFEADLRTRELWRNGIRLRLGGQPFQILMALLENPGQLVSREEFRQRIWSADTFVDFSHGLNAAVNKLREALCDSPEEPRYIETLPRRGYRFIGKVEEVSEPITNADTAPVVPVPPVVQPPSSPRRVTLIDDEWQSSIPVRRQTLVRIWALAAAVVFGVGVTGFFWSRSTSGPSPSEIERFQKQGAEAEQKELALRSKRQNVAPGSEAGVAYAPKITREELPRAKEASRRPGEPPKPALNPEGLVAGNAAPSEESFLLRLKRHGQTIGLFPENSTDSKPSILRVDLRRIEEPHAVSKVLGGWEAISGPQPSPDGKKLVFSAGRANGGEIWVSNIDGSSPKMLTNLNSVGTPRWSPDSRWIAFDSDGRYAHSRIYVVSADGGPVRAVVQNAASNCVPSWSRDGKYIYFASNQGLTWEGDQIWKVPFSGGEPVQITHHGGFSAFESADGQTLYYAKTRYQNPEIWQVPVNGGPETRVPLLHPSTWASWAVTKKGILLLSEYNSSGSQLEYFDFATRSIHALATLERASFWLAASADGSSVWYSELTDTQARQVFAASMD